MSGIQNPESRTQNPEARMDSPSLALPQGEGRGRGPSSGFWILASGFRVLFLCGCLLSCSPLGLVQPAGRPVLDAYHGPRTDTLRIADTPSPFAAKKPVPVLAPPEVFAVYAPARIDRANDLLVGEHWIFLKLGEAEWFAERGTEPEPPVSGNAPDADLAPLRALPLDSFVVPYRKPE